MIVHRRIIKKDVWDKLDEQGKFDILGHEKEVGLETVTSGLPKITASWQDNREPDINCDHRIQENGDVYIDFELLLPME